VGASLAACEQPAELISIVKFGFRKKSGKASAATGAPMARGSEIRMTKLRYWGTTQKWRVDNCVTVYYEISLPKID
jgi:hypothetical protein